MLGIVNILSLRDFYNPAEGSLLRCIRTMFVKLNNIEDLCNLPRTVVPEIKTKRTRREDVVVSSAEKDVPRQEVD